MDKATLLKSRLPERDVEIEGVGTIRIRSLSRAEALEVRGVEMSIEALERKVLSLACIDPVLTEDEVAEWQNASAANELEAVMNAIIELSGMAKSSPKEAMKSFRE